MIRFYSGSGNPQIPGPMATNPCKMKWCHLEGDDQGSTRALAYGNMSNYRQVHAAGSLNPVYTLQVGLLLQPHGWTCTALVLKVSLAAFLWQDIPDQNHSITEKTSPRWTLCFLFTNLHRDHTALGYSRISETASHNLAEHRKRWDGQIHISFRIQTGMGVASTVGQWLKLLPCGTLVYWSAWVLVPAPLLIPACC